VEGRREGGRGRRRLGRVVGGRGGAEGDGGGEGAWWVVRRLVSRSFSMVYS